MLKISNGGITECIGDIFMERMESRTKGPTFKSYMESNQLEWPLKGDNSKYLRNVWRQEVFLSLEATENVTKT